MWLDPRVDRERVVHPFRVSACAEPFVSISVIMMLSREMAGRINGLSNGDNNKEREKEEEICERERESARQVLLDGTYRKNNARTRGNRSV